MKRPGSVVYLLLRSIASILDTESVFSKMISTQTTFFFTFPEESAASLNSFIFLVGCQPFHPLFDTCHPVSSKFEPTICAGTDR